MDLIHFLIDFILHIDVHLAELVAQYGVWVYAILFLILFCETGLVVTPFLPGRFPAVRRGRALGPAHQRS
ncbi:DedA protein [Klebsiella quasipneumoniae]|nr:DedA protein [Klebsiella quasipneumoniae]